MSEFNNNIIYKIKNIQLTNTSRENKYTRYIPAIFLFSIQFFEFFFLKNITPEISRYITFYFFISLLTVFFYRNDIYMFKLNLSFIFLCSFLYNLWFLYILDYKIKPNINLYYYNYNIDSFYLNIYFYFNLNSLSILFIILNNIVILTCIIWSWNYNYNIYTLYLFYIFLDFLLKCCFLSHDIFTFFIFFESILISIFFL